MLVYAIDIDGTALAAPERVRGLYEHPDHFVLLTTSRSESMRGQTVKELTEANIPYHALVMGWPRASCFINDKNAGGLQWPR